MRGCTTRLVLALALSAFLPADAVNPVKGVQFTMGETTDLRDAILVTTTDEFVRIVFQSDYSDEADVGIELALGVANHGGAKLLSRRDESEKWRDNKTFFQTGMQDEASVNVGFESSLDEDMAGYVKITAHGPTSVKLNKQITLDFAYTTRSERLRRMAELTSSPPVDSTPEDDDGPYLPWKHRTHIIKDMRLYSEKAHGRGIISVVRSESPKSDGLFTFLIVPRKATPPSTGNLESFEVKMWVENVPTEGIMSSTVFLATAGGDSTSEDASYSVYSRDVAHSGPNDEAVIRIPLEVFYRNDERVTSLLMEGSAKEDFENQFIVVNCEAVSPVSKTKEMTISWAYVVSRDLSDERLDDLTQRREDSGYVRETIDSFKVHAPKRKPVERVPVVPVGSRSQRVGRGSSPTRGQVSTVSRGHRRSQPIVKSPFEPTVPIGPSFLNRQSREKSPTPVEYVPPPRVKSLKKPTVPTGPSLHDRQPRERSPTVEHAPPRVKGQKNSTVPIGPSLLTRTKPIPSTPRPPKEILKSTVPRIVPQGPSMMTRGSPQSQQLKIVESPTRFGGVTRSEEHSRMNVLQNNQPVPGMKIENDLSESNVGSILEVGDKGGVKKLIINADGKHSFEATVNVLYKNGYFIFEIKALGDKFSRPFKPSQRGVELDEVQITLPTATIGCIDGTTVVALAPRPIRDLQEVTLVWLYHGSIRGKEGVEIPVEKPLLTQLPPVISHPEVYEDSDGSVSDVEDDDDPLPDGFEFVRWSGTHSGIHHIRVLSTHMYDDAMMDVKLDIFGLEETIRIGVLEKKTDKTSRQMIYVDPRESEESDADDVTWEEFSGGKASVSIDIDHEEDLGEGQLIITALFRPPFAGDVDLEFSWEEGTRDVVDEFVGAVKTLFGSDDEQDDYEQEHHDYESRLVLLSSATHSIDKGESGIDALDFSVVDDGATMVTIRRQEQLYSWKIELYQWYTSSDEPSIELRATSTSGMTTHANLPPTHERELRGELHLPLHDNEHKMLVAMAYIPMPFAPRGSWRMKWKIRDWSDHDDVPFSPSLTALPRNDDSLRTQQQEPSTVRRRSSRVPHNTHLLHQESRAHTEPHHFRPPTLIRVQPPVPPRAAADMGPVTEGSFTRTHIQQEGIEHLDYRPAPFGSDLVTVGYGGITKMPVYSVQMQQAKSGEHYYELKISLTNSDESPVQAPFFGRQDEALANIVTSHPQGLLAVHAQKRGGKVTISWTWEAGQVVFEGPVPPPVPVRLRAPHRTHSVRSVVEPRATKPVDLYANKIEARQKHSAPGLKLSETKVSNEQHKAQLEVGGERFAFLSAIEETRDGEDTQIRLLEIGGGHEQHGARFIVSDSGGTAKFDFPVVGERAGAKGVFHIVATYQGETPKEVTVRYSYEAV